MAVHDDKEHLHSHFIVNTVNFETGIKLHETTCNLDFREELNNEIYIDYGIDNTEINEVHHVLMEKKNILKKSIQKNKF
ncbi:hypothetical protein DW261_10215 [Fusobacterium varium]|nr:hypothetical protein DW261_10215 [Fusobacterium varium]